MTTDAGMHLADEQLVAAFGGEALRVAEGLRDHVDRNRATEQALRGYLRTHAGQPRPVLVTSPSPECVREARVHVRRRCAELGAEDDRRDVLELAVSELVGNAVRHGRPPVSYFVVRDGADLLLVVDDADLRPPGDGTDCGSDCEGGRGLFLIAQLARSWGWERHGAGKRVWARV